jgi:hypothetical protein
VVVPWLVYARDPHRRHLDRWTNRHLVRVVWETEIVANANVYTQQVVEGLKTDEQEKENAIACADQENDEEEEEAENEMGTVFAGDGVEKAIACVDDETAKVYVDVDWESSTIVLVHVLTFVSLGRSIGPYADL